MFTYLYIKLGGAENLNVMFVQTVLVSSLSDSSSKYNINYICSSPNLPRVPFIKYINQYPHLKSGISTMWQKKVMVLVSRNGVISTSFRKLNFL